MQQQCKDPTQVDGGLPDCSPHCDNFKASKAPLENFRRDPKSWLHIFTQSFFIIIIITLRQLRDIAMVTS